MASPTWISGLADAPPGAGYIGSYTPWHGNSASGVEGGLDEHRTEDRRRESEDNLRAGLSRQYGSVSSLLELHAPGTPRTSATLTAGTAPPQWIDIGPPEEPKPAAELPAAPPVPPPVMTAPPPPPSEPDYEPSDYVDITDAVMNAKTKGDLFKARYADRDTQRRIASVEEGARTLIDVTPVGTAIGAYEGITGNDLHTSDPNAAKLTAGQRAWRGGMAAFDIFGGEIIGTAGSVGGRMLGKLDEGIDAVRYGSRIAKNADNTAEAATAAAKLADDVAPAKIAFAVGDEARIPSNMLLTSGKKYDTIVQAARDLGWSGKIQVVRDLPNTAGGVMADGTLVVNARAYFDGFSDVLRSGAVRQISGRPIIAHEIGHINAGHVGTLRPTSQTPRYWLQELQASAEGAAVSGLTTAELGILLDDALLMLQQVRRSGGPGWLTNLARGPK